MPAAYKAVAEETENGTFTKQRPEHLSALPSCRRSALSSAKERSPNNKSLERRLQIRHSSN